MILTTQEKLNKYREIISILEWDLQIECSKNSKDSVFSLINFMQLEYFELLLDPQLEQELSTTIPKNEFEAKIFENLQKSIKDNKSTPIDLKLEYKKIINDSRNTWEDCKKNNDFSNFSLIPVIEKAKEILKIRKNSYPELSNYDILIKDFEEDLCTDEIDAFFDVIKKNLIPLIKKINTIHRDFDFLHLSYDINKQKEFCIWLCNYLKFDLTRGFLKESEHPFSLGINVNNVRITTHFHEYNFLSAIFSTIHEVGHGIYEQNIAKKYSNTILNGGTSMGVHESQSRFYENNLGRSIEFWKPIYPVLQSYFEEQLSNISLEDFYQAINISKTSFIRVEADELTYPLHIIIRYEIEKMIFNENLDLNNLENVWNNLVFEYLGLEVTDSAKGLYQDIHWPAGSFGYFPSYAIGSAISSQIQNSIKEPLNLFMYTDLDSLKNWLAENIHSYGKSKKLKEILKDVCNEELNPQYYIEYLVNKYSILYNV